MSARPDNQSTRLRALVAQAQVRVCHTPDGEVWAVGPIGGTERALPIMAPELADWMRDLYQRVEGTVVLSGSLRATLSTLRGAAMSEPASAADEVLIAKTTGVPRGLGGPPGGRESHATQLVALVRGRRGLELFHAPDQTAYVRLAWQGVTTVWPLRTRPFRSWLSKLFYDEFAMTPGGQAVADALSVLEGEAVHSGPEVPVYVRVAAGEEGVLWLDLGGSDRSAVRVTRNGWDVVDHDRVEVAFVRPPTLRPLPRPVRGGDLAGALAVMNLPGEEGRVLAVGWVLGVLAPSGPYLVLLLVGEQGSAKTYTARALRALVDPAAPDLRGRPGDERDLVVAARLNRVCAFDNFSGVRQELSDALARLATGTGFGTRQLYTDSDEVTFAGARPILLNGIGMPVTSADLLDRSIVLELPRLEEGSYRPEDELWAAFSAAHPEALGVVLDGASRALADGATTAAPPGRMADAARWITAASPIFGWSYGGEGSFAWAYESNRRGADRTALEASVIGDHLLAIAAAGFEGTTAALLVRVNAEAEETERRAKGWPQSPASLGQMLTRLATSLRRQGFTVTSWHTRAGTSWAIHPAPARTRPEEPSQPSRSHPGDGGDGGDGRGPTESGPGGDDMVDDAQVDHWTGIALEDGTHDDIAGGG